MIRVAILKPNEELKVESIKNDLESKQKLVGGLIEFVTIEEGIVAVINEEGKLNKLEPQLFIYDKRDFLCGPILFFSESKDGDISDITGEDLERVKTYIENNKLNYFEFQRAKRILNEYF